MTQRERALNNEITPEMEIVAAQEEIDVKIIQEKLANGTAVILKNKVHQVAPIAVGEGLSVKINANIGTSPNLFDIELEKKKLDICHKYGADAVMDLSVGGDINETRRILMAHSKIPVGNVPIYQIYAEVGKSGRKLEELNIEDVLKYIRLQAEDGIDFMTIHAGLLWKGVEAARKRLMGIVSRGGALLGEWMSKTGKENLLYEHYDEILDILREYDVTISLGDGLRPGCLEDATDEAQLSELMVLGELTQRAWDKGVQVMVEGPGHVPYDQIEANMKLQKQLCHGAPFYVLGPLVTDIAPGYDHIAGAIGGTLAAVSGADFLCYLTPAEHLSLPDLEDVREGIIASKIAAQAADVVKGVKKAKRKDHQMAVARKNLDWEGMFNAALDPDKAREYREKSTIGEGKECTMCGDFCAVRRMLEEI
jgi:phosphomethylpyrimidine synthase